MDALLEQTLVVHVAVRLVSHVAIAPLRPVAVGSVVCSPVLFYDSMARVFATGPGVTTAFTPGLPHAFAALDVFSDDSVVATAVYDSTGSVCVSGLADGQAVLKLWLPSQLVDPSSSLGLVVMRSRPQQLVDSADVDCPVSREHEEIMFGVPNVRKPNNISALWTSWTLGDFARVVVQSVLEPSGAVFIPVGAVVQFSLSSASTALGTVLEGSWSSSAPAVINIDV